MSKRPEQTILQRGYSDGQQAHEKIFNITSYQRNANQKFNEMSSHTGQNGHHKKNLQIINAGEDVEKREPTLTLGGNINWYNYEEQYGDSLKN